MSNRYIGMGYVFQISLCILSLKQVGICIDHNAAFMINNADYSVLYPEGLEGSVMPDGTFSGERLGEIQILDT